MEFQCSPGPVYQTDTLTDGDTASLRRDHSQFGDGYSVRSRSTGSHHSYSQYSKDDPEVDYDEGPTELYRFIENKDWDSALGRLEENPIEAKTWVVRREAKSQKIRWRLLPLHAVCIFRAPLALIEALVEVYPDGAKMKDDQGMYVLTKVSFSAVRVRFLTFLLGSLPIWPVVTEPVRELSSPCLRRSRSPSALAIANSVPLPTWSRTARRPTRRSS